MSSDKYIILFLALNERASDLTKSADEMKRLASDLLGLLAAAEERLHHVCFAMRRLKKMDNATIHVEDWHLV